MKKLSDFVTIGTDGQPVFNEAEYAAEMDRVRNEASTTARANAEKDLRKTIADETRKAIEEEAKLSAEEKLAKEREAIAQERKAFNGERFKTHLTSAKLFSDEEIEVYMNLLGDNYEESIAKADKVIAARAKYNEEYDKKVKQELQVGLPRGNGGGQTNGGSYESEAIRQAKRFNSKLAEENAYVDLTPKISDKVDL